jgi:hypothetical protein
MVVGMESAFFTVHGMSWLGMVYVVLRLSIPKHFSYASRLANPEKRKTVGAVMGEGMAGLTRHASRQGPNQGAGDTQNEGGGELAPSAFRYNKKTINKMRRYEFIFKPHRTQSGVSRTRLYGVN